MGHELFIDIVFDVFRGLGAATGLKTTQLSLKQPEPGI